MDFIFFLDVYDCLFEGIVEELAGVGDVDCGFYFVTGEHPDLDTRVFQRFNRVCYFVLEFIFDCSRAEDRELCLHFVLESLDFLFFPFG